MPDYCIRITAKPAEVEAPAIVTERLVRAKNEARAIAHVVKDTISVDRATIDDAMRLAKLNVEVEVAE
jgi:hypothetical protein